MALIDSQAIIARYVPVNKEFDPAVIAGSLVIARDLVIDILSPELYYLLEAQYDANNLSAEQEELLPYVEEALVRLAIHDYSKDGQLLISNSGFHSAASDKRKTAWQWQINDTRTNLKFHGYQALQKLLRYLWASGNTFNEWLTSFNRVKYRSRFINEAEDFSQFYNINNNFCLFYNMRDSISYVEMHAIRPILCDDQYVQLKEQILNDSLTAANQVLLNYIKHTVANMAVAHAIPRLSALMSEAGIVEAFSSERQTLSASAAAREKVLSLMIRSAENAGYASRKNLEHFLRANAANYPLYISSPCYTDPAESTDSNKENQSQNIFNSF